MRFRFNPDDNLRALERAFKQSPSYESAHPLIAAKLRTQASHQEIIQILESVRRTEKIRLSDEFGIWHEVAVIPVNEIVRWNTFMEQTHEEGDADPVVMFTHSFGNLDAGAAHYFADIEVIGGESPFINAVLFYGVGTVFTADAPIDEDGHIAYYNSHEIAVEESASTQLDGQYYWKARDQRGPERDIEFYHLPPEDPHPTCWVGVFWRKMIKLRNESLRNN